MKVSMFSVHDSALKGYLQPFFLAGKGVAFRSFQDEVNKPDSRFGAHPDDYTLVYLGSFDDETGAFDIPSTPEKIVVARDVKNEDVKGSFKVTNPAERDALKG